jgi:hypothetical protein
VNYLNIWAGGSEVDFYFNKWDWKKNLHHKVNDHGWEEMSYKVLDIRPLVFSLFPNTYRFRIVGLKANDFFYVQGESR